MLVPLHRVQFPINRSNFLADRRSRRTASSERSESSRDQSISDSVRKQRERRRERASARDSVEKSRNFYSADVERQGERMLSLQGGIAASAQLKTTARRQFRSVSRSNLKDDAPGPPGDESQVTNLASPDWRVGVERIFQSADEAKPGVGND